MSTNRGRMQETHTHLLLGVYRKIANDASTTSVCSTAVLTSLQRVHRPVVSLRSSSIRLEELDTAIRSLAVSGFDRKNAIPFRLLEKTVGRFEADKAVLTYFRIFEPRQYFT